MSNGETGQRPQRKVVRIGVIDLVNKKPTRALKARALKPNYASIMPQAVAVWAEQRGHQVQYMSYTGFEDLYSEMPRDIDLLFICAFTPAAYLAYSISNFYRKQKVVTVLGGPHARAFPEDALNYFDYVLGFTDRTVIEDLIRDFSPQTDRGLLLSAAQQPAELPGVRERWKYIRHNLDKAWLVKGVQILGSLGCPYKCSFCVDAEVDYQTLPYDQLREDMVFLQQQLKKPLVFWSDPNFGVRFNEYMEVIESAAKPGAIRFMAESTLSLLKESNLQRMQRNNFVSMIVGVESWFGYNNKASQGVREGMDKVEAVGEHVDLITRYIPYVQANLILGLDVDTGPLPFAASKKFLDLAPAAIPAYAMFTSYGNSAPLDRQLQSEGRVLDLPFPFLDAQSAINIKLKNYTYTEFFDHYIDLIRYSFLPRVTWRRFKRNNHSLFSLPRWIYLLRSKGALGKGRAAYYARFRQQLSTDRELQAFYAGETTAVPSFFSRKIKADMGPFYDHLPGDIVGYLEKGHPFPGK